ncbi:uncharacterized protein LOC103040397 isoform X2 [Astyanax mexicanus]|uniref:uncharacterized protein LOC103040397 isoform X2 n=1 Tax=Astyanax mexicanus TaxID=7994 RepID=UPI0020CAEC36|nr:uncharacterized protein LOC103040397 isoform X2 [Astyanax mexicanus]
MNVLQDLRSGGLYIQDARLGSVGPYPLYMESFETLVECNKVSDEIMDALFHLFSMKRPGILAINAHTLSHILDGGARARSHYFIKRNIFKNTREVIGPYLEHGNHWTFFHCSFVDRTITYLNSLGEQDQQYDKIKNNWSTFAAAKGYHGPWKRTTRNHSLQSDSISCGVFTAVFAETFLEGEEGYLTCPPVHEERQRLGLLLFKSLDRSGVCGICHKTVSKKSKDKCLTCLANIHAKCLPVNPEDSKCLFCKGQERRNPVKVEESTGQSNQDNTGVQEIVSSGQNYDKVQREDDPGQSNKDYTALHGEDSSRQSSRDKEAEGEDSSRQSSRDKEAEGEDSSRQSSRDKEAEGEDSSGQSSRDKEAEGEDSSGQSSRDKEAEGEDSSGQSCRDKEAEGEDISGQSSRDKEAEGEDISGQSSRDKEAEGEDSSGQSSRDKEAEGEDISGQSSRDKEAEGEDSSGQSSRDKEAEGEDISGQSPGDQTKGFIVESVLKVSDFHQTKRYLVTTDELQRRCAQPESYSANTVVAYLRKAKGQKRNIEQKLAELEVNPSKRTKLTSLCSKLCEDECRDLADDITYLAAKFIPQKKVGQALLEDGNVHEGMAKTEDCRKTLKAVEKALETNWHTFDLATHGLGPAVIKGTFELIDACLKEKIKALQS